jgi:ribosomal-protein-alanine N-acetyltransferase
VPPGVDRLETRRLIGERLCSEHFAFLRSLHGDPRVMATLGGLRSPDETRGWLEANVEHWSRHGFGAWVFRLRETDEAVAYAGLRHVEILGCDEVEVLYSVAAERWGEGLATEMTGALVEHAFGRLGLAELVALTLTTNRGSQRVMEKNGFAYERDFEYVGLPHVLYRLRAV